MKHTENYSLPQWEKSDRIMMDDFNAMCSSIDSGIAQAQALAEKAQVTAETAQAEAEMLPYYFGYYAGASSAQEVNVGFRPRALLISGVVSSDESGQGCDFNAFIDNGAMYPYVRMTDTGFHLTSGNGIYPRLNVKSKEYRFIAFR